MGRKSLVLAALGTFAAAMLSAQAQRGQDVEKAMLELVVDQPASVRSGPSEGRSPLSTRAEAIVELSLGHDVELLAGSRLQATPRAAERLERNYGWLGLGHGKFPLYALASAITTPDGTSAGGGIGTAFFSHLIGGHGYQHAVVGPDGLMLAAHAVRPLPSSFQLGGYAAYQKPFDASGHGELEGQLSYRLVRKGGFEVLAYGEGSRVLGGSGAHASTETLVHSLARTHEARQSWRACVGVKLQYRSGHRESGHGGHR